MNRTTTYYNISGTRFFRLASRSLFSDRRVGFKGFGGNLQNKEKSIRAMYKPDPDKKFVQADQAGAEALIVAYLCRNAKFRSLFLNGIKSHIFVALHVFKDIWQKKIDAGHGGKDTKCNIDELCHTEIPALKLHPSWPEVSNLIQSSDDWPAAERYYYIAKQICHSSNYNIMPNRFCMNTLEKSKGRIVLKAREAEYYLNFYHGMFPEIREWHDAVVKQIEETGYLFDLHGFPHYFFHKGELKPTEYKEYFACVPQATVGLITRTAFTKIYRFMEETKVDWDIMQDNHDSILMQCPPSEEEACAKVLTQALNQELTSPRGEKFNMKSEVASGWNWAPYHDKKNPEGLKKLLI